MLVEIAGLSARGQRLLHELVGVHEGKVNLKMLSNGYSEKDLRRHFGSGPKTVNEIKNLLDQSGLSLEGDNKQKLFAAGCRPDPEGPYIRNVHVPKRDVAELVKNQKVFQTRKAARNYLILHYMDEIAHAEEIMKNAKKRIEQVREISEKCAKT